MTPATFDQTLHTLCDRVPFRPFTVILLNSNRVTIDRPDAIAFRNGKACYLGPKVAIAVLAHDEVVEVLDGPS